MEVKYDKNSIQYEINGVQFDMFTKDYVRKNSVKQITESVAFDTLNCPNKGGLCDPALGVSVYDKISSCVTCGHNSNMCAGHFGHIELAVILYNPLMMKLIYKLLRAKCFNCHKLKIIERQKLYLHLKILLIKLGHLKEASDLHTIISNNLNFSQSAIDSKIFKLLKTKNLNVRFEEIDDDFHETLENTTGDDETVTNETLDNTRDDDSVDKFKKRKKRNNQETSIDKEEFRKKYEASRKEFGEKIKISKFKKLEEIIKLLDIPFMKGNRSVDIEIHLK